MIKEEQGCHYLAQYMVDPPHKISVSVIGAGGTGSQVLVTLARINATLLQLGRTGLQVEAWDDDEVSETNIGRQHYSPQDIGKNKAEVLITRINRFYGTDWQAIPARYDVCGDNETNIIITCVDNVKTRVEIEQFHFVNKDGTPTRNAYYWLDFGNTKNSGQAILSTLCDIEQPESRYRVESELISPIKWSLIAEDTNEPSCSMREALLSQDLLINSTLVTLGIGMLWELLKEYRVHHNAVYVNTQDYRVTSSKI